jgi:hypothetical protein
LTSLTRSIPHRFADQVQSDINSVQNDWGDVKTDAQNLHDSNQQALNSAWNSFKKQSATSGGVDGECQNSAKSLASAVQSSVDSYHCTTSSSGHRRRDVVAVTDPVRASALTAENRTHEEGRAMAIGQVQLLVLGFDQPEFSGSSGSKLREQHRARDRRVGARMPTGRWR